MAGFEVTADSNTATPITHPIFVVKAILLVLTALVAAPSHVQPNCTPIESVEVESDTIASSEVVDVEELFASFAVLSEPKDEFETTAQHQAGIDAYWQTARVGGHGLSEDFLAELPVNAYYVKYDADHQRLNVEYALGTGNAPFELQHEYGDVKHADFEDPWGDNVMSLDLVSERGPITEYEASNAYGKSVVVSKYSTTEYALLMMNVRGNTLCDNQTVSFPVSPTIARELKDNLGMVVRFKVRRPYTATTHTRLEPKIDSPMDVFITTHNIVGRVEEAYLVDRRDRRVWATFRPTA